MTLLHVGRVSIAIGLTLGCAHSAAPPSSVAPSLGPPPVAAGYFSRAPGYVTISPEVTVSRNAQPFTAKPATLDEHADVMAEILALPPGQ